MNDTDLNKTFIAVAESLGFVATNADSALTTSLTENAYRRETADGSQPFRMATTAVAYLQASTGWRQRVRLTVLLRVNHPVSRVVPRFEEELLVPTPEVYHPPRLPSGKELDTLLRDLAVLVSSGEPVVLEKSIADRLPLDSLSPRVVGANGVQVVQRQTIRVWNTLALWMQEQTRSPRGTPSMLRGEVEPVGHFPRLGEGAPLAY